MKMWKCGNLVSLKILLLLMISVILLVGCGSDNHSGHIADAMSVSSMDDAAFYVMRVNDDYLEIPGACKFVYLSEGGTYPKLENGQIAKVTADIDIYDGGEAGYMNNIFIKDLKEATVVSYGEVADDLSIPEATIEERMNYGKHMLQYRQDEDLYFIVLNRKYIDVYLNEELFIEYQWKEYGNILDPFFEKIR